MRRTLIDILEIEDFGYRRTALRLQVTKPLKNLNLDQIKDAFEDSVLVGTGDNQIKPRRTHSGLREALCEDAMIALIQGTIDETDILDAIKFPSMSARENAASKTGYDFGCPRSVPHNLRDIILKGDENMTKAEKIEVVKQAIAQSMFEKHVYNMDEAVDLAISCGVDKDVAEAAKAFLQLQTDAEAANMTEHLMGLKANGNYEDCVNDSAANSLASKIRDKTTTWHKPKSAPDDGVVLTAPANTKVLDLMLSEAGLPDIKNLLEEINLRVKEVAALKAVPAMPAYVGDAARGELPSGKVVLRKASEVFGLAGGAAKAFKFDVPVWEWDGVHPDVPAIDEDYIFRGSSLLRMLYALLANKRTYLWGDSGTGKTSLVEQVSARLNTPFLRMNFDSDVSRMDLVGRDTLTKDGDATVSKFVDGILPQMLSGPNFCCFDEVDFCRPDVAYVMQRLLEGDGLVITEDGGRVVKPHPMCRIFATGNTQGQGDDRGMYAGARVQSAAMLDRFGCWIHVDYLDHSERAELMRKRVPSLPVDALNKIAQYVTEHIEAFKDAKVMQPITPRGYVDLCEAVMMFSGVYPASKDHMAFQEAMEMVVLDRATAQDRAVLMGIAGRICA